MYSQKKGLVAFTQRRSISWFVFVSLLVLPFFPSAFFPSLANASGPSSNRLLNYQLRLTDPSGIPVADGTKNVKISFYAASTGGTPVATDCGTTGTPIGRKVVFTNGVGSVLIGETTADASHNCTDGSAPNAISATLFDSAALFIGITVESDTEMTPRKRVVATGYSLNADKLDDLDSSAVGGSNAFVPVTDSSGNLTLTQNVTVDATTFFVDATNNMVGVGTVTPGAALHVRSASPTFRIEDSAGLGTLLDITSSSGTGVTFRRQGSTDPMIWTMGSSERMRLTDGGNLGIGDTTPAAMLTVGGGDAFQVDASGNMIMNGEMTVNGSTNTIGNAATDTLALNAELVTHILPDVDDTYDLGSNVQRWRDLYLGPATLHIGTATGDEAAFAYDTTTNLLSIDSTGAVDINGGSGSTGCSVDASGNFVCSGTVSGGSGAAFVNGGNSFGGAATLGTNDNFSLNLETNNTTRVTLDTTGRLMVGQTIVGTDNGQKFAARRNDATSNGNTIGYIAQWSRINSDIAAWYMGADTSQHGVMATNNSELRIGKDFGGTFSEYVRIDLNGDVGIGTSTPNEQLEIAGNFRLPTTTATTGIIKSGADRFIHNFGSTTNFFAGTNAGNLTLSSTDNVGIGFATLSSLTSAQGSVAVGSGALDAVTSGNGNVGVGTSALGSISSGTQNTAVGHVALADSLDSNNTAVGWASQRFFNGGIANTSLGTESMFGAGLQSTGDLNTALGYRAGFGLTTGSANVLAGYQAGDTLTTGDYNVLLGYNSDVSSSGLTNAVAIGKNALVGASDSLVLGGTGADAVNVGIGIASPATPLDISFASAAIGFSDPSSVLRMTNTDNTVNNVAGISFGDANTNGLAGMSAVFTNHTGGQLGADLAFYAAVDSTISRKMTLSGDGDLGVGVNLTSASKLARLTVKQAADETNIGGTTVTDGSATTVTGSGTKFLSDLGIGDRISLSGAPATYATVMSITSDTVLAVDSALSDAAGETINAKHGIFRLDSASSLVKVMVNDLGSFGIGVTNPNNSIQVSGLVNFDDARLSTFLGKNAGANNTGLTNTAIGYEAMNLGSGAGNANTALGYSALSKVTGGDNVGIGSAALFNLTSGARNIGIGSDALITNSTASDNIAIGYRAARFTTGSSNIVIGREALQTNTTGNNNVGIGHNALFNVDAGNNTALGHNAGDTITTGSSNTLIGASADVASGALSNATAIGANASVGCSDCLVLGNAANVGIGIASPANPLSVMNAVTNGPSPIKAKFVTGGTGGHQLVQTLLTDSIGDMVDGFGPFIEFKIEDTANVENQIGLIGFTRDGGDGNGKFRVYPNSGGAPRADAFAVAYGDANGPLVGVGTATPDTLFNVQASNISLQIEPLVHINNPSTGDSALQFSIVGDAYAMGIDNSDADKFKISYSSTSGAALLGTNDRFVIDDTGRVGLGVTSGAIDGRLDVRGLGSDDLFNLYDSVAQNVLTVLSSGNVGIGDTDPASLLTVGSGDLFNVNTLGDITSNFTTLNGSSTASGSGSGSTTLILTSATNFNIGNYVKVDSTDCVASVNTCYAKITDIATNTLTISPALTWADTSPVTEVHVPEIGGVDLTQALANRYGRGYFIDGIVVGNGTTYITDNKIESSGTFSVNAVGNQPVTFGTGTVTFNGQIATATGTNANFDSGTLFVDSANDKVGIGTITPQQKLAVLGGSISIDEGLLITPYAGIGRFQNYLTRSEEFDNATWTKESTIAFTANGQTAPDGSATADTVTTGGASGTDGVTQTATTGTTASQTYTGSVWMKMTTGSATVNLRVNSTNETGTASAKSVTTSWQRFTITQTFTSGSTGAARLRVESGTGTNIVLWGAQLEIASAAGVYAKTIDVAQYDAAHAITAKSNEADGNLFLGHNAGRRVDSTSGVGGNSNTALGVDTLFTCNVCDGNTAIGYQASYSNTHSDGVTAIGAYALYSNADFGDSNTAVGESALYNNTDGFENTAVGASAGAGVTTGNYNVAMGAGALNFGGASSNNTAVGQRALRLATGGNNTALGYRAGGEVGGGSYNIAIGSEALLNPTGGSNIAIGYSAILSAAGQTPSTNIGIGDSSLRGLTTGAVGNIGIGQAAGFTGAAVTSGTYNTFLGYGTGLTGSATLTKAVAIGANALVGCSNCLVLGGTGADAVSVGIGTTSPNSLSKLHVVSADTTTAANQIEGIRSIVSQTGALSAGNDYSYGLYATSTDSGAHTGGAQYIAGLYATASDDNVGGTSDVSGLFTSAGGTGANSVWGVQAYASPGAANSTTASLFGYTNSAFPTASTSGAVYGVYSYNAATYTGTTTTIPNRGVYALNQGDWTGTSYGIHIANNNTNTTVDGTSKYGLYIDSSGSYTGSGGAATNNYGLYVASPSGGDNNYGAIFAGGNVGIGDSTPLATLTVGSGDLFQVAGATGSITTAGGLTVNGLTTLGDATSDTITFTARAATGLNPNADNTLSLGATSFRWNTVFASTLTNTSANLALSTVTSGNITLTTAGTTGLANVLTGNLKVGDGSPGFSLNGEDAYIEGTFEVDGTATFGGSVGIGTTSPTAKLEIDRGDVEFTKETAPAAPTVAINATAGNLNGSYTYKVTFVTAAGETEGGTTSASVAPANQQVDLTAIPTGTSGTVTARKIYRTVAGGTIHRLVTTINDNTSTTYTDNIADASLGTFTAPTQNTTAAGIRFSGIDYMFLDTVAATGIGITINGDFSNSHFRKERRMTAGWDGLPLTIESGGAGANQTDKFGGNLVLKSGVSTGTGTSQIEFYTASAGSSGTSDNDASLKMTLQSTGLLDVAGDIQLNISTSSGSFALCHGTNGAANNQTILDCSGTPAADYAEMYPTASDVVPGDIVALGEKVITTNDGDNLREFVKATTPYARGVLGVVSDPEKATDFNVIGYNIKEEDRPMPIALNGRVSALISTENGVINPGDPITSSSTIPGAGMKATEPGMIVGFALDAYDRDEPGTLLVFVNPGWWNGVDLEGNNASSGVTRLHELTVEADHDMKGFGIVNVGFIRGVGDLWSIDTEGRMLVKEAEVEKITVKQTDNTATIDRTTLSAGETYVQVHNDAITPDSRVFVTFRKNPGGAWWIDEVGEGFFVLKSAQAPSEDAVFDYWLIGVSDERTPPALPPAPEPTPEPVPDTEGTDIDNEPVTDTGEAVEEDSGAQPVDNSLPEGEPTVPEEPTEPAPEEVSTESSTENP